MAQALAAEQAAAREAREQAAGAGELAAARAAAEEALLREQAEI